MFEILQPFAQWVIDLFDVATGHAFIILCGILYCVDFIVSTLAALQLGEKLEGLQTAMEEFTEYLQTTKVYSSTEEARELFGNYKKHLPTKSWESIKGTLQARLKKRVFLNMQKAFALVQRDFGNSIRRESPGSPA